MLYVLNKWLFYPWLKNNDLDFLINRDDLEGLNGLGLVLCLAEDESYITVKDSQNVVRVRREGVKKVLPHPKFTCGEIVKKEEGLEVKIEDIFLHHNKNQYLYHISENGKRKSRRYTEEEVLSL